MAGSYKYSHRESRLPLRKALSKPGLEQAVYESHRRELEINFKAYL